MMNVMRDERGQALAEFALIMPILFLLIAGILGFGRAYNIQQVVVDAAREGARVAAVQDTTMAPADPTRGPDSVVAIVKRRLQAIAIDTSTVTVNVDGNWRVTGDSIHVDVSVPYSLPLLSVLMNWATGTPNFNLHSTTTMRNE
jgi:Flp pilus assembly protein TadG